MRTIDAMALFAGIAATGAALAQTPGPGANAVIGGTHGAAIGGGVGATSGAVSTPTDPPGYNR